MKKIIIALILNLFISISSHAGTIGMSGQWDFDGYGGSADSALTDIVTGFFDFDAGTISMESMFFGIPVLYDGTISEGGGGLYEVNASTMWGASPGTWDGLWDITDNGDGTASVVNGLTFYEPEVPYIIEGTLTAVPLPGALWLFGSGLLGIGLVRRKL